MLSRTAILALATIAGLGAAAMAPPGASAGPNNFPKLPVGIKLPPKPPAPPGPNGIKLPQPHPLPPPIWWIKWHHPHHHHWGEGEGATETVGHAPVAAAPPVGNCNCLTKQYLEDGSVLFKDLCTKEEALASPDELKAQAQALVDPPAEVNR
jgi:hypothetical protein